MDDDDERLNMRDFGYHDTMTKPNHHHHHQIPLQLMPTMDFKPLIGERDTSSSVMSSINVGFPQRDCGVHASHYHMDYMRDWIARYSALPGNNYSYSAQTEGSRSHHHVQMMRQSDSSTEMQMVRADGLSAEFSDGLEKKRSNGKPEMVPKAKKPKKAVNGAKESGGGGSVKRAKAPNKPLEVNINGINMDISTIPIPVCSCTGVARQCYRWGSGGWQSACCTTGMSMYPLPMSTKRRGARIAGRKMSLGAFKKVLEKLVPEGYDFSNPINLRTYWAKHGTNKFVTIR